MEQSLILTQVFHHAYLYHSLPRGFGERSPFTSEVAGSILSENVLNVTRTQCSTHVKSISQHSAEILGFPPTGNVHRVG